MKNLTYQLLMLAFCTLSLTSCSRENLEEDVSSDLAAEVTPVRYSAIELDVMGLINQYRLNRGLSELEFLDEISWLAEDHNSHMIEANELCHDGFPIRYSSLVSSINAKAVSENVAYDYTSAEAVVNAWVKSDGHRKNMEGNVTHFGISVKEDGEGKLYFTNIFVRK